MMTVNTDSTLAQSAKWAEAFDRLCKAETACQEYIKATDPLYALEAAFRSRHGLLTPDHRPDYLDQIAALRESDPAYFVPEYMNDHRDALVDAVVTIEGDLMAMPSPDLAALHWKLEKTAGDSWDPDYIAQMRADMVRLLGPAPSASDKAGA